MKKTIRMAFLSLALPLSLSLSTLSASAEEAPIIIEEVSPPLSLSSELVETNLNVSTKLPSDAVIDESSKGPVIITPYGTGTPTSSHNLVTSGQMNFSGQASHSTLYTNKFFTGTSNLEVYVDSRISTDLTFKVYKNTSSSPIYTGKVTGGGVKAVTFAGLSSTGKYYISFSAPSNFTGYVKAK
jgi:hypothetical protein